MKLLVFGTGQLGIEMARLELPRGWTRMVLSKAEADLTDPARIAEVCAASAPDVIVNAAAYTAVGAAAANAELAYAVNAGGPATLAENAKRLGAALVHVSTDYVFDGTADRAYHEDDPVAPLGVYGASKAAGEEAVRASMEAHWILRTSWVYSPQGRNFVKTMLKLMTECPRLSVVDDQRGNPTSARDLARAIQRVLERFAAGEAPFGTFHVTGSGSTTCTWHGFAREIQRCALARLGPSWPGGACDIAPIPTSEFPTPVARPAWSVLDCSRFEDAFGFKMPPWRNSLADCLAELLAEPEEMRTQ